MSDKKNTLGKKRILIVCIVVLIVIAGIFVFLENRQTKENESAANVVPWDVDISEEETKEIPEIYLPGYESMNMTANEYKQTVSMGNPADNQCYFVITLSLEDGTTLYQSQELKPGEGLQEIKLEKELDEGDYTANIQYQCYTLDTKEELNGGTAQFVLYVR